MRRSTYASDMDVSVSVRGVRIAITTAAALAVAGSGFAFGRATATCSITVTHAAPVIPVATPTASPSFSDVVTATMAIHTSAGAAAAATAMATILSGPSVTQADAYRAAVVGIAAPGHRDALLARADRLVAAVDAQLGVVSASAQGVTVVVWTVPVSWHVDSYTGTTASVRIWAVGLVAEDGSLPATTVWATGTFDIEWTDTGWRLDDVQTVAGPVPQTQEQATVTTVLPPELGTFSEYQHAPAP